MKSQEDIGAKKDEGYSGLLLPLSNPYVEILTPKVMAWKGGAGEGGWVYMRACGWGPPRWG